jgi:magnesium-transporting ATPase (P-type)
VELILSLLVQVIAQVYFFLQVRKMENNWNQIKIKKIVKGKSKVKMVRNSEIKIGDLVLIKNSFIAPADILVVATSDIRHGDSIFHTNERRIDGQNIFYTKRAVRNLITNSKTKTLKALETINKMRKILTGYVEYEPPHPNIKFQGIFKLANDPKISSFSSKNIMLAGTKLCSSW